MSAAKLSRLPANAILSAVLLTAPAYAGTPLSASGGVNNVEVATTETSPKPSPATAAALEAVPANKDLANFDPTPFKADIDEIAELQRKNRILKLRVERADLERELAEARGKGASAIHEAASAPAARSASAGEWSVSSIQGAGSVMSAVLVGPSGWSIPVKVGSLVPGTGRVSSIAETGVSVRRPGGTTEILPFMGH